MCSEFTEKMDDERILGLVMVPGRHIISIYTEDTPTPPPPETPESLNNETPEV